MYAFRGRFLILYSSRLKLSILPAMQYRKIVLHSYDVYIILYTTFDTVYFHTQSTITLINLRNIQNTIFLTATLFLAFLFFIFSNLCSVRTCLSSCDSVTGEPSFFNNCHVCTVPWWYCFVMTSMTHLRRETCSILMTYHTFLLI